MRAKSFLFLLIILAAAGAAIGAGLNYALDDAEADPTAKNAEFISQAPVGLGQGGQLPSGLGGGGADPDAAPVPSEPGDYGATAPDTSASDGGDGDAGQQPANSRTPPGGLGGGLVSGSIVDFDPPALVISTEAGSASFLLTDETVVSLQRSAAESADVLVAGANALIVAAANNDRTLDTITIIIGDFAGGGPLPPGGAFGNFSLLSGEIESVSGGVITLKREQDVLEVRYADDVTVSAQLTVDEASEHITPGIDVRVGAQPSDDGTLKAGLIMVGDLDGFGLGAGFMRSGAGLGGQP